MSTRTDDHDEFQPEVGMGVRAYDDGNPICGEVAEVQGDTVFVTFDDPRFRWPIKGAYRIEEANVGGEIVTHWPELGSVDVKPGQKPEFSRETRREKWNIPGFDGMMNEVEAEYELGHTNFARLRVTMEGTVLYAQTGRQGEIEDDFVAFCNRMDKVPFSGLVPALESLISD